MKVKNVKGLVFSLVVLSGFVLSNTAQANPAMIKAYKKAFPDARTKCINCHVSALPKKAEGRHEWDAYGLAVKKAAKDAGLEHPSADTFKKVGRIEDFKEK